MQHPTFTEATQGVDTVDLEAGKRLDTLENKGGLEAIIKETKDEIITTVLKEDLDFHGLLDVAVIDAADNEARQKRLAHFAQTVRVVTVGINKQLNTKGKDISQFADQFAKSPTGRHITRYTDSQHSAVMQARSRNGLGEADYLDLVGQVVDGRAPQLDETLDTVKYAIQMGISLRHLEPGEVKDPAVLNGLKEEGTQLLKGALVTLALANEAGFLAHEMKEAKQGSAKEPTANQAATTTEAAAEKPQTPREKFFGAVEEVLSKEFDASRERINTINVSARACGNMAENRVRDQVVDRIQNNGYEGTFFNLSAFTVESITEDIVQSAGVEMLTEGSTTHEEIIDPDNGLEYNLSKLSRASSILLEAARGLDPESPEYEKLKEAVTNAMTAKASEIVRTQEQKRAKGVSASVNASKPDANVQKQPRVVGLPVSGLDVRAANILIELYDVTTSPEANKDEYDAKVKESLAALNESLALRES